MGWTALVAPILKFITWLGTVLIARKAGKDAVKADVAEKGLSNAEKANRAASDPVQLDSVRERFKRR